MSNTDIEPPRLYAAREPIFPRRVHGWFRNLKWVIMAVTLAIYYITPWIRWNRGPNLPDQAVLVDLANRRFYFFWIEIWPHEFYFVAGLLVMAGLGLFLFTSALGRVWCGYACPQTVWTDLFILTERWVEGDRNARLRLWNAPWSLNKLRLRLTKWTIWLVIAVLTGGAWIFYFTDAPTLLKNLLTGQAHPVAYITMGILTATTFVFGGFAREQICIYACPWPRIQAAMMDEDTLTVAYRDWRGEPRGKIHKGEATRSDGGSKGDCIDCMACVNVCPMGIDIRDGQQLECITCALCIDACDDVMAKIGKPRGLIDYMALRDEAAERAGQAPKPLWRHILRPRTILYFTLWSGIGIAMLVALFLRSPFDLNVTPVRNPLYVTMADGAIRNAYALRLRNKQGDARIFELSVAGPDGKPLPGLELGLEGLPANSVEVAADSTHTQRLYLTVDRNSPLAQAPQTEVILWAKDASDGRSARIDTVFHGRSE
ncbi:MULTISPECIES: cytochrome c oxidase accessory protein CcoG [unclassified Paracoccus (in: a-proteobacteria)]|uniref:cytochrome c oxidase accessory protein CcoG n=1 Tax=unclassified Paracoccus (in: a-proteobacteria) TaxID=2688777 RepID=UPI0012B2B8B9|nr:MULTISPECIES: cytochrome c oxidase accessory protein CcoG [unclassified Paracoccus (in: a-proteobacteria)]UXU76376.1 cytochrome c oxidase accessory protein CcoG [Paracoccus sp. SMMA_5]UXU82286.1 cytochrome c oxidase accessory protein CcoG [Paracoccus sp. SMMA_5_TC]